MPRAMTDQQLEQYARNRAAQLNVPWQSSFADACAECVEAWSQPQCEAHITRAIAREQSRRPVTGRR
jgi:hypothetical protein